MKSITLNEEQMRSLIKATKEKYPYVCRTGMPFNVEMVVTYNVTFNDDAIADTLSNR